MTTAAAKEKTNEIAQRRPLVMLTERKAELHRSSRRPSGSTSRCCNGRNRGDAECR